MRAKFELCVKVVGLVLFCSGVITVLFGIPFLLHRLDIGTLYPTGVTQDPLGDQLRSQMRTAMSTQARWTAIHLLLCGAIPTALGLCLMRFGGMFVRFCYPGSNSVGATGVSAEGLDLKIKTDPQGPRPSEAEGEQRYAPPDYFKPEA